MVNTDRSFEVIIDLISTKMPESTLQYIASTTILFTVAILLLIYFCKNLGAIKNFYYLHVQYLWDSPIRTLEAERKHNKYYPFIETKNKDGEPVYRLEYRKSGWNRYIGTIIITSICIIKGILKDWDPDCIFLMSIIWLTALYILLFKKWGKLTLDVETDGENYHYYSNDNLLYCGHVSDVYIRAKMGYSMAGGGEYYYLVLHGFNVEEYRISGKITISKVKGGLRKSGSELKDLKRQGKRIAHNLNLNYFDTADRSKEHRIVHMFSYEDYACQKLKDNKTDAMRQSIDFVSKITQNRTMSMDQKGNQFVMENLGQLRNRNVVNKAFDSRLNPKATENLRRASQVVNSTKNARKNW